MALERFAASWREAYVSEATDRERTATDNECIFCSLVELGANVDSGVIAISELSFVCLNAFPYGSGHVLVLPRRHMKDLDELTQSEASDFTTTLRQASRALTLAYRPDGQNIGINLGRAAGAGLPEHLHAHVLPRWNGDTNFMSSIGETRVLPESLSSTWHKVASVWDQARS